MVGGDKLDERGQAVLVADRHHVGVSLGALGDRPNHVRKNTNLLRVELDAQKT